MPYDSRSECSMAGLSEMAVRIRIMTRRELLRARTSLRPLPIPQEFKPAVYR